MKIIISLLFTVFPYSIFADSFDLKLDCVGIRGVSIDKSGYIGEIKKRTSKARLDIKYVTIKNKICLVENKNGDTMKYKLVDFDVSYMMFLI